MDIIKMTEYSKTILMAKKMVHPRVLKVLQRLSNISPGVVPRDLDQPKAGCLIQIKLKNSQMEIQDTRKPIIKPDTCLNLNSSLLHRRKQSMSLINV